MTKAGVEDSGEEVKIGRQYVRTYGNGQRDKYPKIIKRKHVKFGAKEN